MQTDHLAKLKDLDPRNKVHFEKYIRQMRLNGVQETTISNKCWRIYVLLKFIGYKDLSTVDSADVEDFIIARRASVSPHTLKNDLVELKQFFKFLLPDKIDQLFTFKLQRPKNTLPVERLLTPDDAAKLVSVCSNQRDRAIVSVLWDTGCRIDEIMSRDVEHVVFDKFGAVVIVRGKTGMRRVRLISSAPDLQQWVNQHPDGNNPKAPLFTTFRRYRRDGGNRLNAHTVGNLFKTLARRAEIPGDMVYPHALRHGRLTDLAKKGFSEGELRIQAGWSGSSSMPDVYIHLGGDDVERRMLAQAGLLEEEEIKKGSSMDAKRCPRCKTLNAHDARYCSQCSMALDEKVAINLAEMVGELENDERYQMLVKKLLVEMGR